ncbi:MAG: hypothetical protein QXU11_07525 [Thermoproteota archaeon]
MVNVTRIFNRLPSDAGVTFEGFEEIKVGSRESVRKKLEDFIEYCRIAKKPAIRAILGEWGEGKTDAYRRYIQPKSQAEGNYAFFVSASTLANGYELPSIKRLLDTTPLSAVRFLVVLFSCIKEESKEVKIPEVGKYTNAYSYLNDVLSNLINGKKSQRIFVFIDEFEELLLNPPRLKDIISGIKEVINGRFEAIDEKGEYAGCLHFVIAVTPDAFYRLQIDPEIASIFGGLGRRTGVIELPQIRKQEGMEFLYALLKYSYNNSLPEPLPFSNLGVFCVLFRITQGNPGNLVSLFVRLMSSAKLGDEQIRIIDNEHLLTFLGNEEVFVYGGTTACLDTNALFRILKVVEEQRVKEIGEKCVSLLKIFLGELKPFSIAELETRIGSREIKNIINIINESLKIKEKMERAILKLSPLREGKTFNDIMQAFNEYIIVEKDKKFLRIDSYHEGLEEFEDRITYFTLEKDKIAPRIYLPSERYSLMSFLEGITLDKAIEIENLIKRKLCKDEDYYLASDELLSQIFPTPVPRELEFIKNRERRMQLWREVTRNLAEQYENYMPAAFMRLLERSGLVKLIEKGRQLNAGFSELVFDGININCMFYSVNGDVKSTDVENICSLIRDKKPPIHCIILLYTGEITSDAEEKIENKELGRGGENIILEVHLHPVLAKRIISIYKASFQTEQINESLFTAIIKRIVDQELDFENKLRGWLSSQKEKGVFIPELRVEATSNPRELAGALKFYVNFMGEDYSAREVFDRNRNELLRFVKYEARKISLIPDIEFQEFENLSRDLKNNDFLMQTGTDKYRLKLHPVEKRILSILEKKGKLLEDELKAFFITKNLRYLDDVFLPVLEYKGLVKQERNSYLLNDKLTLFEDVKRDLQNFKDQVRAKRYQDYGYILMAKERGYRFFTLEEFKTLVEKLYQKAQETFEIDEEVTLQRLSLVKKLLQHFREEFIINIDKAAEKGEEIIGTISNSKSTLEEKIEQIIKGCKEWLKLILDVNGIEEYRKILEISNKIDEYLKYSHEQMVNIVNIEFLKNKDILGKFMFRYADEQAFYFNPKLYLLASKKEDFDQFYKRIEVDISDLNSRFQEISRRQRQIESEIMKKDIPDNNKISKLILMILSQLTKDIFPQVEPVSLDIISLAYIKRKVDQSIIPIRTDLDKILGRISDVDVLSSCESSFLSAFKEAEELCQHVLLVFDSKEYEPLAKKFESGIKIIEEEYRRNCESIMSQDTRALLEKLTLIPSLITTFNELKEKIKREQQSVNEVWDKYSKEVGDYIDNIKYILNLLAKRYSFNTRELEKSLEELRKIIGARQLRSIKRKFSEIEHMKIQVRQQFYEIIKPALNEKELQLLELVVKKIRSQKKEWLSSQELYQSAKEELDIHQKEIDDLIQKLIERGFFKSGISLSF